jgi:hypothetical protein
VFTATVSLVTGTMFLMWLGEQITERGLGNGISMIIFAGIVAGLPAAFGGVGELVSNGEMNALFALFLFMMAIAVTGFVVFVERGQRRITVNYAKRQQGRKMYAAQSSHLPLKLNMAGVIPPIFASSIILFPTTLAQWAGTTEGMRWLQDIVAKLSPGEPIYVGLYAAAIIFFCFFYTALVFNSKDTADNLKRSGAFHPGHTSGRADRALHRSGHVATHDGGGSVHHRRLPAARVPDRRLERAVLLRRYVAADRRNRGHGLHGAGAGARDVAPVRRPDEESQSEGFRRRRNAALNRVLAQEISHESSRFSKKDLSQLQNHQAQRRDPRHLHRSAP